MKDVEGKVAFITGGASGIGLGAARVFSEAGMKVVIADIRRGELDRAMASFHGANHVHPIELDVTDRSAFERAADEAERVFGKVDLVFNNAGVNLFSQTPLWEASDEDWEWVMGVNFKGVLNGVRAFAPRLIARAQGGHIVNTASMASFLTGPSGGIYATSKFAVRGLTESLRYGLAEHNIGVSVLCPGLVNSQIYDAHRTRPDDLETETGHVDEATVHRIAELQERAGMDPVEMGQAVLRGVRANDFYIIGHPEFGDELKALFQEAVEAVPEGDAPSARLGFEHMRQDIKAKAGALAKTAGDRR